MRSRSATRGVIASLCGPITIGENNLVVEIVAQGSVSIPPPGNTGETKIRNPFYPKKDPPLDIPCRGDVRIFNQAGVEVQRLNCPSGTGKAVWDGKDAAAGTYLVVEDGKEIRKVVIVK